MPEALVFVIERSELQELAVEAEFRGFGVPVAKSAALLLVSVQPLFFLKSAVVLLGAGARLEPSKQSAVVP